MRQREDLGHDWSTLKIQQALKDSGWPSYRALSRHAGYAQDSLKAVVRTPNPNYEQVISDAIGVPPEKIWPSRYCK
ncbi:helix-turn-helix domain-containing protein [Edwardsiella anguillarum]|uniref:helix-turn-helix domain-containing protein n=1 Tax=Edwardsiella anguillarum TaxID=1821960 RepID=UPI0024B7312D|nr:helix-turn-helix domain-containing protein [Edwardsiella anguillarum]WHQ26773.1 helix-turn-helix domain-containing protein [Edwardsiella anguillarum]